MYFRYVVIIFTWERTCSFSFTFSGSGEENNAFSQFCYYLSLGRGVALHLNKQECPLLSGSGDEDENMNSLLTDGQTTVNQKSSLELLAKLS